MISVPNFGTSMQGSLHETLHVCTGNLHIQLLGESKASSQLQDHERIKIVCHGAIFPSWATTIKHGRGFDT